VGDEENKLEDEMDDNWKAGTGMITAVACMAGMLFVLNAYPEVAGRGLQVAVATIISIVTHHGLFKLNDEGTADRFSDIACQVAALMAGCAWLCGALFAPLGIMRGVNDLLVIGAVVVIGGLMSVNVPSFYTLSVIMWLLFVYDYMMTVAISQTSLFTVCHTEMCGALDVIEDYRLPMALRFWNGSALGMGDLMVGAVAISFSLRRYGNVALLLAPAYVLGLFLAVYWSATWHRAIPALVPIVPSMWIVMACIEAYHVYYLGTRWDESIGFYGDAKCVEDSVVESSDATPEEKTPVLAQDYSSVHDDSGS